MESKKTVSVKELRDQYGVCKTTFAKWLRNVPGLYTGQKRIKLLNPAQHELILNHLGKP